MSNRTSSLPTGCSRRSLVLIVGLLAVVFVCMFVFMLLNSPSEPLVSEPEPDSGDQGQQAQIVEADTPTPLPRATTRPVATAKPRATSSGAVVPAGEQKWLVMLYLDADDRVLEQDISIDLNEAETIGSSDRVQIVAQMDRFRGGYTGTSDWSSTKRFYVERDADLRRFGSQELDDLGEVNMSDADSLVDFVTWAVDAYPADRHVLILSDHGMGWPGGWSDPAPGGRGRDNIALAQTGDHLWLMELDEALDRIQAQSGVDQFDIIGMDACLMGHLEVMSALAPYARYAVLSQETEPALGWAYSAFLGELQDNPDQDPAQLATRIVETYISSDLRIVDDRERQAFMKDSGLLGSIFGMPTSMSPEDLANQMGSDATLTAVDLAALPALNSALNDLAYQMTNVDQSIVAGARTYAQSFTSIFGKEVPPSYVDLGHYTRLIERNIRDANVTAAAGQVLGTLQQVVVAERHGSKKPGASGVSVYFPNSDLFRSSVAGPQSYTTVANRFASESLWDDFLVFHYTGRRFEPQAGEVAVPEPGAAVSAPGSEQIEISNLTVSSPVAAPGQPVTLRADIHGDNIGYIYLFVGYYDAEANSIYIADRDYLQSGDTRQLNGVYYPDWGDQGVRTVDFEWEPIVYGLSDGTNTEMALFSPEEFGSSGKKALYSVEGVYSFADGSDARYAVLLFRDGVLKGVLGFTGSDEAAAPHEITPQRGDQFTLLERWIDLGASGQATKYVRQEGATLTFGAEPFVWQEMNAAAGDYVVGFIVEDLDGNSYEAYETVNVRE